MGGYLVTGEVGWAVLELAEPKRHIYEDAETKIQNLDDVETEGKIVLMRADFNSPIDTATREDSDFVILDQQLVTLQLTALNIQKVYISSDNHHSKSK